MPQATTSSRRWRSRARRRQNPGGGIEARAFHPLPEKTWAALAGEALSLTSFLADREPGVYSRYGHWWDKLPPSAEVRLLPGK
ncbi:hypothetical protein [Streptomyces sp. NBC_00838]|uniref:hypothetical protein n=1 Tax=Streptomyces sp. NBC_00838 TaxID=2903680 RepID=UPI003867F5D4